jgi:hypothetical protein
MEGRRNRWKRIPEERMGSPLTGEVDSEGFSLVSLNPRGRLSTATYTEGRTAVKKYTKNTGTTSGGYCKKSNRKNGDSKDHAASKERSNLDEAITETQE